MNTNEIDGLFTEEDIKNRYTYMFQCRSCKKWTKHVDFGIHRQHVPCESCGEKNYDPQSAKSLRTFNYLTDNKRKPK